MSVPGAFVPSAVSCCVRKVGVQPPAGQDGMSVARVSAFRFRLVWGGRGDV